MPTRPLLRRLKKGCLELQIQCRPYLHRKNQTLDIGIFLLCSYIILYVSRLNVLRKASTKSCIIASECNGVGAIRKRS